MPSNFRVASPRSTFYSLLSEWHSPSRNFSFIRRRSTFPIRSADSFSVHVVRCRNDSSYGLSFWSTWKPTAQKKTPSRVNATEATDTRQQLALINGEEARLKSLAKRPIQ